MKIRFEDQQEIYYSWETGDIYNIASSAFQNKVIGPT
jgi:hypothetical protein